MKKYSAVPILLMGGFCSFVPFVHSEAFEAPEHLEEVIVTARRDSQASSHVIGEVTRLSSQELENIAHTHIQEAAVRIPGVWLSRGDGQELLASVRSPVYTGPGSCGEVLIAENGLPIRPSGLCNVNQLFEVNTEQAGGLEVLRGAGTVFYGSNAMHGVVNVLAPTMGKRYGAYETGYHDYHRVKLGWYGQSGDHEWQLDGNGNNNGSFKDDSGFDQQKVSLQHRFNGARLTAHTHFSYTNLNQETAGYVQGYEAYDSSAWNDNDNPEAFRDADSLRLSTRIETTFDDGAKLVVTPFVRNSDMTFMQHYLPTNAIEENGQDSWGVNSAYAFNASESLRVWVGLDLEAANLWVKEEQELADNSFIPSKVRYQGTHYDFEVDSELSAVFVNAEWRLSDATTLDVGVRSERVVYDYNNKMIDGSTRDDGTPCVTACRYYRPSDDRDAFDNVSGHVGVLHHVNAQWQVYGRLANAYRAPQINERYRLLNGQSVDEFEEKDVESVEVGARYVGERLALELSAYHMRKDDVILKASNNATVGDGETTHTGVELALAYEMTEQWSMSAAAAWAEHEVDSSSDLNGLSIDGNTMDTAPQWQASAQLAYQFSEPTQVEMEWVYMDDYYLDAENTAEYDGHSLLNLRMSTQWDNDWVTSLRIKNLTDTRYAERADYAFGSYRYFVGGGRGAFVEVRRNF